VLERARREAEVGERAALLTLDDAGVEQLLEVVADRRLLERQQVFEVAHADRVPAGGQEAVEDLHAVAVGERLEHALKFEHLLLAQARSSERGTALNHGERRHARNHIEKT
jgi:hypothetical protein